MTFPYQLFLKQLSSVVVNQWLYNAAGLLCTLAAAFFGDLQD